MKNNSQTIETTATLQQLPLANFPTLTYSSGVFPAKLLALLESVQDLTIQEAHYFLMLQGLLKKKDQGVFYLKMLKDCYLTTTDELTKSYCPPLRNWVITRKHWYLTATISTPPHDREYLCLLATGSSQMMMGKGLSKPYRFTLVSGRGSEIRMRNSRKKVCEVPAELSEHLLNYPIGWTAGIPSTQRKSKVGNAVTVNVIKAIFKQIIK